MILAKSSIQSIDLDELERKLRNFVDPSCPNVSPPPANSQPAAKPKAEAPRVVAENTALPGHRGQVVAAPPPPPQARPAPVPGSQVSGSVKTTDLDDVERQLREVATSVLRKPAAPARKGHDSLAELAQVVRRDRQPGVAGRARHDAASSASAPSAPASSASASNGSVKPIGRQGPTGRSHQEIADAYQGRFRIRRPRKLGRSRRSLLAERAGPTRPQGKSNEPIVIPFPVPRIASSGASTWRLGPSWPERPRAWM